MRDVRFGGLTTSVSAGTSFFDEKLNREIEEGRITKGTVDRYSIIVMAGIASEGMCYERAEGGASDEEALVQFLRSINPEKGGAREFDIERVKEQARLGVGNAAKLLKEHEGSWRALIEVMKKGGDLGDCIIAIEGEGKI
ncbi:hypothetical protein TrVE_jg1026 [Triparma verrucosa]|uniref:Uncharacterized protein n=1 Tax=Triparma verrucosa TaxID=1606542 RepID=A0A9W7B316_9STRA|nr:hypothetical protein TrVE_jg1026 [Triparma verrucosa]